MTSAPDSTTAVAETVGARDVAMRAYVIGHVRTWPSHIKAARLPWLPVGIVATLGICAILAPWIAPSDPGSIDVSSKLLEPLSPGHLLGTDALGRDVLSRLIFGARTSAMITLAALIAGAFVGTLLGLVAGYRGGWIGTLIMRSADAVLGFPTILIAMIIAVMLGAGLPSIILAVVATVWGRFARMIRGEVLRIKELDFVTYARVTGLPWMTIVLRHVFPNTVNTLMVIATLQVGQVILLEASLSFLGLGLPVGAPSWGIMVAEGRSMVVSGWWISLFPGVAITSIVLAFNFFGDWLRDSLDPKLRRV